jgi:paraquat-inducible protein B
VRTVRSTAIGLLICAAVVVFALALLLFPSGALVRGGASYVLCFDESVTGLDIGAPVRLLGVAVGHVRNVAVDWDPCQRRVRSAVTIALDSPAGGRWEVGTVAELLHPPQVLHLVGTLQMESLVTGKLFIDLVYDAAALGEGNRLVSRPSSLRSLGEQLARIADGLGRVDFDAIGRSLELALRRVAQVDWLAMGNSLVAVAHAAATLLDSGELAQAMEAFAKACARAGELCGRLQEETVPALAGVLGTCRELGAAAETLRLLVDRGSPLPHELENFLQDVARAARSVRNFFDFLEQNPNALLRGKWGEGTQ